MTGSMAALPDGLRMTKVTQVVYWDRKRVRRTSPALSSIIYLIVII
jgi:hypothetical protein